MSAEPSGTDGPLATRSRWKGRAVVRAASGARATAARRAISALLRAVRAGLALLLVQSLAVVQSAAACPDCAVGRRARSQVWSDDFALYLLVAALPFLLIGAICLRVEAIGRPPRRSLARTESSRDERSRSA